MLHHRRNNFDLTILVLCAIPQLGAQAALLRLLRLLRVLKLLKMIEQLQIILKGLYQGMASIGYIAMLLFMVFYLFGIIGIMMVRDLPFSALLARTRARPSGDAYPDESFAPPSPSSLR